MAKTYFQAFELDDGLTQVTAEYTFRPGGPDTYDASRGGPGGWDPGDPPECEIVRVFTEAGDVKWSDAEDERFCNYIIQNHDPHQDDDYDF